MADAVIKSLAFSALVIGALGVSSAQTATMAAPAPASANSPATGSVKQADIPKEFSPKQEMSAEESLLHTKRIFVDSFGDDAVSKQIQAMVVSQLTESSRFIVTEYKDKADASLKGTGLEKTSQEFHSYNSATAAGSHSGAVDGSWSGGTGSITGYSHGAAAAIQDSNASTETINEARVAVRLVNRDGDVIWATTQESKGAKYKGASADVAEMVVKQLLHDVEKAERKKQVNAVIPPQ